MNKMNFVMLVMSVIALTSCNPKVAEVEPAPVVSAVGIWSTNCTEDSSDSYIETLQIENGTMTYAKIFYSDTRVCDPAHRQATIMKSGSITIADGAASITGGKNFEWRLSAAMAVPESNDIVTMLVGFVAMTFFESIFIATHVEVFQRQSLLGIMPLWLPFLWAYGFIVIKRSLFIIESRS